MSDKRDDLDPRHVQWMADRNRYAEQNAEGVDLSLIEANLKLTPEQRLQKAYQTRLERKRCQRSKCVKRTRERRRNEIRHARLLHATLAAAEHLLAQTGNTGEERALALVRSAQRIAARG